MDEFRKKLSKMNIESSSPSVSEELTPTRGSPLNVFTNDDNSDDSSVEELVVDVDFEESKYDSSDSSSDGSDGEDVIFPPEIFIGYNDFPLEYKRRLYGLINSSKCRKLKGSESGAFGTIEINKNSITKHLDLFSTKTFGKLLRDKDLLEFSFERFMNYCVDIKKYVREGKRLFRNNFIQISNCGYCLEKDISNNNFYKILVNVDMKREKWHERDMKYMIQSKKLSDDELSSIGAQIYLISSTMNKKSIFHNDLKPANILIGRAPKNIIYNTLGLKLKIKKGDRIPIFIDYDLISFDKYRPAGGATLSQVDFGFFEEAFNKMKKNVLIKSLEEEFTSANNTYRLFVENGLDVKMVTSSVGGKKRRKK